MKSALEKWEASSTEAPVFEFGTRQLRQNGVGSRPLRRDGNDAAPAVVANLVNYGDKQEDGIPVDQRTSASTSTHSIDCKMTSNALLHYLRGLPG